jgi:phosphatidylglycerol---prolipoprotein diacylglyceryl transferase
MIEIPFSGEAFNIFFSVLDFHVDLHIHWYGIFIMLAVVALVGWTWHACRREPRISDERILTVALVGIPAGIIFARLVHVIDRWEIYSQNLPSIFGGSGLTIWGAIIGATIGLLIYFKVSKFEAGPRLLDMIAPGILLGQVIGRFGCTINGCCYGEPTTLPWAIIYTHPQSYGPIGIPVHPTQLYEVVYNLIAFGILLSLRNKIKPDGSLFLIYLCLYSVWRIGIGFLRPGTDFLFGLHQAQIISITVLLIAVPIMVYRMLKVRKESIPFLDGLAQEDGSPTAGAAAHLVETGDVLQAGQEHHNEGENDVGNLVKGQPADEGKTEKSQ